MSFYITLPSNSSMNFYPNNTLTNYRTQLPIPLKFEGIYEVSLVEMIFRQSWNIDLGILEYHHGKEISRFNIQSKDGEYTSNIIDTININLEKFAIENLKKILESTGFTPDKINQEQEILKKSKNLPKLILKYSLLTFQCPDNCYFKFIGPFKRILGLVHDWFSPKTPPEIININNIHIVEALYIYCDIIDYQFVGDTKSQLLRTVVVSNNYNSLVSVNYENPHYVSLNQNQINSINIDIRSDTGDHVHFLEGKVIIKLHFRPKKNGL